MHRADIARSTPSFSLIAAIGPNFPLARGQLITYIPVSRILTGEEMTQTGLQKLAYFLLLLMILFVSCTGGV